MQPTNKPLLTSTCIETTMLSIGALHYASCSSGNGLNEMCLSLFKNHMSDMKSYYKFKWLLGKIHYLCLKFAYQAFYIIEVSGEHNWSLKFEK